MKITEMVETKQQIRQRMRARRQALRPREVGESSRRIITMIRESRLWARAHTVGVYLPFDNEVDIRPLIASASATHRLAAPRVLAGGVMSWHVIRCWEDLETHERGFQQPRESLPRVTFTRRDLVLVPGLAFDRACHRLGFGLGCYDRFLKDCPAVSLGLAYAFQVVPALPCEPHDIALHAVCEEGAGISEKRG